MVKLVMLGVAHPHAESWVRAWQMHTKAELVGIWDENQSLAQQFAERHGLLCFQTMEQALAYPEVERRRNLCRKCETCRLYHCSCTGGKRYFVRETGCDNPERLPVDAAGNRTSGRPLHAGVSYARGCCQPDDQVHPGCTGDRPGGEFSQAAWNRLGGRRPGSGAAGVVYRSGAFRWGAFLDEGIHAADFLIWMFGEPKYVTAKIPQSTVGLEVEDNGIAIVEFANGVIGTLQSSWTFAAGTVTTEIFGLDGTIQQSFNDCASTTINGENNFPLQVFRKGRPMAGWENPRMPIRFKHIHEVVAERFIDCLETGDAFPSTLEDGYAALRLVLAAYQSAKDNRTVAMEEI